MRNYVQIDANTDSTVFKISNGACCSTNLAPEDITAHITRKGACDPEELVYNFDKLEGDELTVKWDDELFKLCAGWYIVKIMNGCRECGSHTMRIGRDCVSRPLKNLESTHNHCKEHCEDPGCTARKIEYCCEEEDCCCEEQLGRGPKVTITKLNIEEA